MSITEVRYDQPREEGLLVLSIMKNMKIKLLPGKENCFLRAVKEDCF
jgi:hypothetical protein